MKTMNIMTTAGHQNCTEFDRINVRRDTYTGRERYDHRVQRSTAAQAADEGSSSTLLLGCVHCSTRRSSPQYLQTKYKHSLRWKRRCKYRRWGPRGLSSTSRTARGQKIAALALASKASGLGLGLAHCWPWPWPRKPVALALALHTAGLGLGLEDSWPWPWPLRTLALASNMLASNPSLANIKEWMKGMNNK